MRRIDSKKERKPSLTKKQRFVIFVLILNVCVFLLLVLTKHSPVNKIYFDLLFALASFREIKSIFFTQKKDETSLEVK